MSGAGLYVFVHHRVAPRQADLLLEAYEQSVGRLAGTPGLLGTELLVSPADRSRYLLLMCWAGRKAFQAWERREREAGHPSALRPFQDRGRPGGHYEIYTARRDTSANGSARPGNANNPHHIPSEAS